ncbi:MAG: EcsC family protein [Acidocella sp.]|nr:EcsC family protein [Acidocella sp.]
MKPFPPLPAHLAGAHDLLTQAEQDQLWRAAILMADSRTVVMRLTAIFGRRIEDLRQRVNRAGDRVGGPAWGEVTRRVQDAVEDTLWSSFGVASFGLNILPGTRGMGPSRGNMGHRVASAASGVASGFIGLPGILFDIPFTTTTILRSIAQIARDAGEDLDVEDTRRACLQILAYGGPSLDDDETETGYWATRIGTNHLTIEVLMKAAAARFGIVLSEKFLAQAVPLAGAVTGGALNYAFTRYYQDMAQVSFTLRALDRRTGQPVQIRRYFTELVSEARNRRRISRKPPEAHPADAKFFPSI